MIGRSGIPGRVAVAFSAFAALISPSPAALQTTNDGTTRRQTGPDDKRIEAIQIVGETPEIDGILDDRAWQGARWTSDFTQKEPNQGEAATLRTEIAFLYDEHALYIGARLQADEPSQIGDQMTRRDEPGTTERLIVSLDTYHDRRTAYSFAVTAAGVRLDYYHPEDNDFFDLRDFTYDPVWVARTKLTETGWSAEMRIPFSQLRFNAGEEQVWGVNINRYIPSINEDAFWVVVPRDQTGWASRFGELVGIQGIAPSRRIEVTPYVASSTTFTSDGLLDPEDPFAEEVDMGGRTGLDFQMGLGPNLTLDATINPDFGQVEADPAEVNLTAFETFFDERRPFFTKGQENFYGLGPDYFYSRRIGAPPHRNLDDDYDFNDAPSTSTIWGAAKLTGRLPSGLTVGALAAVTDDEHARAFDAESSASDEIEVEPYTAYGIVRLQKQIGENASTVGATLTGVDRRLEDGGDLASRLPARAFSGGIDWNKRFTNGWYEILGHAGFSRVEGDTAAIRRLQERSAHFFQRPDQGHVEVDPARTSLSGWSAALRGGKRTGSWRWNHGVWMDSPGLELNDIGSLSRADDIQQWIDFWYRETDPGAVLRNWELGGWTLNRWNFDGVRKVSELGYFSNYTLLNFVNGFFEGAFQLPALSDDATRGGPLMESPRSWWISGGVFSNFNRPTRYGLRSRGGADELGGWEWRIDPEFHLQPTDRLTLSALPRYIRQRQSRQYLDTIENGREATFGSRYVFGVIDRSEIAASMRANYSFSPMLSVELYAEPFAASGRYVEIGELEVPRTADLVTYGEEGGTTISRDEQGDYTVADGDAQFSIENPDFDVLSFRSNLVLRWEYRPGSTLFVVWQQNRSGNEEEGRLVGPGKLLDSFGADGMNVLGIKFTYWLPL